MSVEQSWRETALDWSPGKGKGLFCSNEVVSSKYTIITFLPKNLFEQCRRMVNFFFLTLIIIQVSIDIPVNPIPYAAAFIIVIAITAVKQGYEDWCRHRADRKVNFAQVEVVDSNGNVVKKYSKDIHVGQMLRLSADDAVPCDLLLVTCNTISGTRQPFCQITTANLDGESNLKMRFCVPALQALFEDGSTQSSVLSNYTLKYDEPKPDLYNFSGQISSPSLDKPVHVTMENVLLRGSTVKNCKDIYAICIYAGKDTRLSMNSNRAQASKFSTIEHTMNKIVIAMFVVLMGLSSIALGLSFVYKDKLEGVWYLPPNEDSNSKYGITIFISYAVLLCYMIPVSLPISFELQKLFCSKFFVWDNEMVCSETQTRPICNTSDLNEELGQVEYLLTDKTGTLTENELVFRCCSINGAVYQYSGDSNKSTLKPSHQEVPAEMLEKFLVAISCCHTVRVIRTKEKDADDDSGVLYQSASLDEEVLVKAASSLGVQFSSGDGNEVHLNCFGDFRKMRVKSVLEFDSDRKCMSLIVQNEDGSYIMFSKGAESSILPKCTQSSHELIETTEKHVTEFAKEGYRTLVIAYKELNEDDAISFLSKLEELQGNPDKLKELYVEVERDFHLLGCTGMEDKLQDGVPETLKLLTRAGIKVLMLTGDKLETAVSVAASCGLLSSDAEDVHNSELNTIDGVEDLTILRQKLESLKSSQVLVIDGRSFAAALEQCKSSMLTAILTAKTVIFCRMAPIQKRLVVKLIKSNKTERFKTCAVGDGGNDCAMLREADLGIGIMGKEGLQAARESDFAVARFRFLQRAILVHGFWYYYRLAGFVTFFFYRGIFFIFQVFFYGFESGFSANTIFHSTFVMMFTISFTSVPVVVQGLTDEPFSSEELLNFPELYHLHRRNATMSFRSCLRWFVVGAWHTVICYFVPRYVWSEGMLIDDYGAFSLFVGSLTALITNTKILAETKHWTLLMVASQIYSYGSLIVFYMLLCHATSNGSGSLAFSYIPMLQQPEAWLCFLLIGVMSTVPDILHSTWKNWMGIV